ncbi:MAG: hypothetical protein VYA30_07060 [Myxococcota bacterium]|nr:hypothetical protein [Myxococcota bacterium]
MKCTSPGSTQQMMHRGPFAVLPVHSVDILNAGEMRAEGLWWSQ